MSKGNIIIIVVSILLVVLFAGAAVTWFGDGENPFEDIFTPNDPVEEGPVVLPETQYNATFGTNFKEDYPISTLALRDNMQVAPYDGARHTEDSFKKTLKKCLANLTNRKDWKYMGVWERSPQKQRLHFHGIFYIPEGTMPGLLCTRRDYNFSKKRMVEIYTNTYFEERLGRNDFEPIEDRYMLGSSLAYLMKYIEKSGEKIVYSKGLPPYFISDIMENDVVCFIGQEENKLLLYDDFLCFAAGICVGPVSSDTIKQLRKAYE